MNWSALTFNVLYDGLEEAAAPWSDRVDDVAGLIRFHEPTLVGLQECWMGQADDLREALPEYEWFGENRDVGEHTPVGVRGDRATIVDAETFWLAPDRTDRRPAWDATLPRLATRVTVEARDGAGGDGGDAGDADHRTVDLYNVHLDVDGPEAREESARILRDRVADADRPVVLTGDYNSRPGSRPLEILSEVLRDARTTATHPYGPLETYHGFDREKAKRIDYVFATPDLVADAHGVLTDVAANWLHPSDHWPVLARLRRVD